MCGRYATTRSAADLSALFEAVDETEGWAARYNVAPTDRVPVVRASTTPGPAGDTPRVLTLGRWGLLPHWARDPKQGAKMINARAETVATTRAYADAFARRRALVPVDGWYEWRRLPGGGRQPYFITPRDGSVLALAGLWSRWGPERVLTFTIVTTAATGALATVHDRMPVVLPPARRRQWLVGAGSEADQRPDPDLLAPPPADVVAGLELRPVGAAVGNVRNDGPRLLTQTDTSPLLEPSAPTLF